MIEVQSGMKKFVWRIVGDLNARLYVTRKAWSAMGLNTTPALGLHCRTYADGSSSRPASTISSHDATGVVVCAYTPFCLFSMSFFVTRSVSHCRSLLTTSERYCAPKTI